MTALSMFVRDGWRQTYTIKTWPATGDVAEVAPYGSQAEAVRDDASHVIACVSLLSSVLTKRIKMPAA